MSHKRGERYRQQVPPANQLDNNDTDRPKYIAIEGPTGVGKSILTQRLSEAFESRIVLDVKEENPFLENFYSDRQKFAFQAQVFFLLSRYRQQYQLCQPDLFQRTIFSDYIFARDRLYASVNLSENEMLLYDQIYQLLDTRVIRPDLVVYLQARLEVLLDRIELRGRTYEKNLNEHYLKRICTAYSNHFFHYTETPLLVVDTSDIDLAESDEDFRDLTQSILRHRGGIQFYKPLGR